MLKISDFYLDKQKSFISKKNMYYGEDFTHGFDTQNYPKLQASLGTQPENTHGIQRQTQPNPYPWIFSGNTLGYPWVPTLNFYPWVPWVPALIPMEFRHRPNPTHTQILLRVQVLAIGPQILGTQCSQYDRWSKN